MEHNKELPQIQEIMTLIQEARGYSTQSLQYIEKLNGYATQIQGCNMLVQQILKEQTQILEILSEQNPELEILKSARDRAQEALANSIRIAQIGEESLQILDLSANEAIEQEGIVRASSLLKGVIACLNMLEQDKLEVFMQTMANNQNAENTNSNIDALQNLKNYIKG